MSKFIIDNRSKLKDDTVFVYIGSVVSQGKISNEGKSYCYMTTFDDVKVAVSVRDNKCSTTFVVWDMK